MCTEWKPNLFTGKSMVVKSILVKLVGIELKRRDNPRQLMEHIQKTVAEHEIDLQKFDYDRCHRIGKIYKYKGVSYQNVLLRLRSWTARDTIYKKRKELTFKIQADLTTRRSELLDYAKDHVSSLSVLNMNS